MKFDKVKDDGDHKSFEGGAKRSNDEGKGKYVLLPPRAMKRLARHFENGIKIYGARNWERGLDTDRYMDSAIRHAFSSLEGKDDEDHDAAIVWNILCKMETEELIDDGLLPENFDTMRNINKWQKDKIRKAHEECPE